MPSCVFVNIYYDAFMDKHYREHPGLAEASYDEQMASLMETMFGDCDFYSRGLAEAGWVTTDLIINCEPLQRAWARERGVEYRDNAQVMIEQIKVMEPDVVYTQGLWVINDDVARAIRPYVKLVAGQVASPTSFNVPNIDVVFTSMPHFVPRFHDHGVDARYIPMAFEPRVLEKLPEEKTHKYHVTFVGGITAMHSRRREFLKGLVEEIPVDCWGYGFGDLQHHGYMRYHGEVWGLDMFRVLRESYITLNVHIDAAENNANNMRLYEATGCGALLLTDFKDNLGDLFEVGREVVAFGSVEGAKRAIGYYKENFAKGSAIARRGQRRTLRDHTYARRMAEVAEILEELLCERKT